MRYYVDTCVWRDYIEDRKGRDGRFLGEYATQLFTKFILERHVVVVSKLLWKELQGFNPEFMIQLLQLQEAQISEEQRQEAQELSVFSGVSQADCLHAIIARDSKAVLVTQNVKDFLPLQTVKVYRPEELL